MVHIVTVHWRDDRWIDVQLKYLRANIRTFPFKVYAFLNGLRVDHSSKFFYSSTEPIASHAVKLNLLADMAAFNAEHDEDLLIFIDGDAFPVGDVIEFARSKLSEYPLIAIQRRENAGDIQPHPSFCLTTIGFWKEIKGDWKPGFKWRNSRGDYVTDIGGNLLKILAERSISWFPMLRSNRRDLHPLWFGLYEDIVYHHGAGFRPAVSRADVARLNPVSYLCFQKIRRYPHTLGRLIPKRFQPEEAIIRENDHLSEQVFASILSDFLFYRRFKEDDWSRQQDASRHSGFVDSTHNRNGESL